MANRQRASSAALQSARQAFKDLHQDQERFRRNGLGPGEAYIGLWRACHDHLELLTALRAKLASKALRGAERRHTLDRYDLIHDRMRNTLHQILPYERPKLQAVGPDNERINPKRVPPDFSKLSDAELTALEKILLKVGGPTAAGPAVGADSAGRPAPGMATPGARNRAAKNRTELR
jgi:hypothetical protein